MSRTMYKAEGLVISRRCFVTLMIGFSIGFCIGYNLLTSSELMTNKYGPSDHRVSDHYSSHNYSEPAHKHEDRTVAEELAEEVKVLCWVMTYPGNHHKARTVKATWGKRCNKILFMSTAVDKSLPTVELPVLEGSDFIWAKTKAAFRYVYEHYRYEADWFFKADDDTYVIVENLRYLLAGYNSSDPLYFGFKLKNGSPKGYMAGGAGYVLSRAALDRFVNQALPSPHLCYPEDDGFEDVEMGNCLEKVGVEAMDSRDENKRGRFFMFSVMEHMFPTIETEFWNQKFVFYPSSEGLKCCSDYAISFHHLSEHFMHEMEYLIYHLRPYGITTEFSSIRRDASISSYPRLDMLASVQNIFHMKSGLTIICQIGIAGCAGVCTSVDDIRLNALLCVNPDRDLFAYGWSDILSECLRFCDNDV